MPGPQASCQLQGLASDAEQLQQEGLTPAAVDAILIRLQDVHDSSGLHQINDEAKHALLGQLIAACNR